MKTATRFLAVLAVLFPMAASAQTELTVREINRVPEENLAQLEALGAAATQEDVDDLIEFVHAGETVSFTAVVLSDPYNSGLASWVDEANVPGRVHVFVRDTSANSLGYEGMTIQIVDGTASVLDMQPGFVYDIIGEVAPYQGTIQISPTTFQAVGPYASLGLPDEIVEPRAISTDDLNQVVGQDADGNNIYQANWENFNDLNNEFVIFDEAIVTASVAANDGRPNYQWVSAGAEAAVNSDDISLRYRNDRSGGAGYPNPPYATRESDNPFIPPAAGAIVQVQGFANFPAFDFDNDIEPGSAAFTVAPWEDSDLQTLESPPVFGGLQGPTDVPGDAPVTISVPATPGTNRTISSVVLSYEASTGESGEVTLTDDGSGVYSGQIPAVADGAFVTYTVTATDNTGATSTSEEGSYRVLYDGITSIAEIQTTASLGAGGSPFAGITTENIDLEAVVMSDPTTLGLLTIQDSETLEPWSGVFVELTSDIAELELQPGDRVAITAATVAENFDVTELQDVTLTRISGGEPYDYKVVPTGALAQDPPTAEAHEGMALRFEDVVVTDVNADGDDSEAGFGEFQISSDGTEADEVRVDDQSEAIPSDFNITNLAPGAAIEYVQGAWYYSFGNYKLLPVSLDDIGQISTATEVGPALAGQFVLEGNYPNPFAGQTAIRYAIGEAGPVTLKVYDVTGREVATLVDEVQPAATYEAAFDATGLASGVYFARLTVGERTFSSKLTVIW